MSLALDIRADLADLLDDPDYGRKIVLRRATPGTYDPDTGGVVVGTTTSNTTRGLLLSYKDYVIDGSMIKQGDRKCIFKVSGMTMVPQVEDLIDLYNAAGSAVTDTLRVISTKRGELGGTDFLYVAQVRA